MSQESTNRRLIRHGMVLFLWGLLTGVLIPTPALTSPRLALAAHVEVLLDGMFLILVGGVVWKELRLSERLAAAGFWLLLVAAYASWDFCLLAAAKAASVHGAGATSTTPTKVGSIPQRIAFLETAKSPLVSSSVGRSPIPIRHEAPI